MIEHTNKQKGNHGTIISKGILVLLFLAVILLVFSRPFSSNVYFNQNNITLHTASSAPIMSPAVFIDNRIKISVTVASTTAAITKGLSGSVSLDQDSGMLFIFNTPERYRFWMPDMNYSLDMIWIGSDMKIVDISRNVPPLLDKSNPIYYRPDVPAQYVLEVNAGWAERNQVVIGNTVSFLSI